MSYKLNRKVIMRAFMGLPAVFIGYRANELMTLYTVLAPELNSIALAAMLILVIGIVWMAMDKVQND